MPPHQCQAHEASQISPADSRPHHHHFLLLHHQPYVGSISPQLLAEEEEEEEEEGREHSARTLETVFRVAEAVDWGACWGGGVF